jgi:PST family polysaccharide transporter
MARANSRCWAEVRQLNDPLLGPGELSDAGRVADAPVNTMRRGFAWTALGRGLIQIAQLANVVILARILTPADFGYATVTASIVMIATLIADVGISTSMVHFRAVEPRFTGSALSLNLAASLGIGAVIALAAQPLAALFGGDALLPLFYVAAAGVAASPWSVPLGTLAAQQRFAAIVTVEVAGALLALGVSLISALAGAGAVSLVVGPAVSAVLQALAFYLLAHQRLALRWDPTSIRDMLGYGMPLVGFGLLSTIANNVDRLALARSATPYSVGLYSRAAQFAGLPNAVVQSVVHRVMLPSLSRLSRDRSAQFATWRTTTHDLMLVACGGVGTLCTTAPFMVVLALGEQWDQTAPVLTILLTGAPFMIYQGFASVLFQACGRTRLQLGLGAITALATIGAAVAGARSGALALASAVSIAAAISTVPWIYGVSRLPEKRPFAGASVLLRPLLLGSLTAGLTFLPSLIGDGSSAVIFALQVSVGLAVTSLAFLITRRRVDKKAAG